jgi:exodeoxyribonuclease-3
MAHYSEVVPNIPLLRSYLFPHESSVTWRFLFDLARPDENYNKTAGYTQVEIDGFKNFLNMGLVDTYRMIHKDRVQYSYWSMRFRAREKNLGWRIDYFLVSERLMPKIKDAYILDQVMGSDHCPVGIEIEL